MLANGRAHDERHNTCRESCGACDQCLKAKFALWLSLCEDNAAVYAIENGAEATAGVVVWLGNEIHGQVFDGNLIGKTGAINAVIADRMQDYPMVRMTVPANSLPIAKWAERKLGFRVSHVQRRGFVNKGKLQDVIHLWRNREWDS